MVCCSLLQWTMFCLNSWVALHSMAQSFIELDKAVIHVIRTIIPKKFSHCCKNSRLHNRFPNLGIQQRNCISPGNLTLKVSRIWLQNIRRTGETDSWRAQENLVCTRTQEIGAVTPQKTEPDLSESIQESPVEVWVDSGLPWGQYHWLQQS